MLTFFFEPFKMKKSGLYWFILTSFLLFLGACNYSDNGLPNIPAQKLPKVKLEIKRYGQALFTLDTVHFKKELTRLKRQFPYFLDADLNNPGNLHKLYSFVTDTQIIHIYHLTIKKFPNITILKKSLNNAFSHLKYYYPDYQLPHIYTYISDLYYERPVIYKDSIIVIGLDNYLGSDFSYYLNLNIPFYRRRFMVPQEIPVDVMKAVYFHSFKKRSYSKTLLDNMIEAGKQLYFLDAVLPNTPDSLKIRYSSSQLKWMQKHKKDVWAVLIRNQMLYSGRYIIINRMIKPGPFTEGFSRNSPPSMGTWFGWQIVRAYMKKNSSTDLPALFNNNDSQDILQKSEYKP